MNEHNEVRSDVFDGEFSTEKAKDSKKTTRRLFQNLMQQKWKLIVVLVSTVMASVFGLFSPKVMGEAINRIFDGIRNTVSSGGTFQVNFKTMGTILLLLFGLYLLQALFTFIQQKIMASVSQTLTLNLRKQISDKLNRLPLRYFDNHKKGEILSRVSAIDGKASLCLIASSKAVSRYFASSSWMPHFIRKRL